MADAGGEPSGVATDPVAVGQQVEAGVAPTARAGGAGPAATQAAEVAENESKAAGAPAHATHMHHNEHSTKSGTGEAPPPSAEKSTELGLRKTPSLRARAHVTKQVSAMHGRLNQRQTTQTSIAIGGANGSVATFQLPLPVRAKREVEDGNATDDDEEAELEAMPYRVHPNSEVKQYWDLVMMYIILYSVVSVPYRLAFLQPAEGAWLTLDGIFDIMFGLDMIVCFLTAYEEEISGALVWDYKLIACHYFRTWFFIDLVSTFPFDRLGAAGDDARMAKLLRGLRLMKLVRLVRLMKLEVLLEKVAEMWQIEAKYLYLSSLMFTQLFCAHLIACTWYGISAPPDDGDTEVVEATWVYMTDMHTADYPVRYMYSLYWAFATMTTVGYGDVYSVNNLERVISIVMMLVGVTVFGYTVFLVSIIIVDGDPRSSMRKKKAAMVSRFLTEKGVRKGLRHRVRVFFSELISASEDVFEPQPVLSFVHEKLRSTVACKVYSNNHSHRNTFISMLARPARTLVLAKLRPCYVQMGETLINQGELGLQMYMLTRGRIELRIATEQGNNHLFTSLQDDAVFGEVSLCANILRPYSAIAAGPAYLAFLSKEALLDICETEPDLRIRLLAFACEKMWELEGFKMVKPDIELPKGLGFMYKELSKAMSSRVTRSKRMKRHASMNMAGQFRDDVPPDCEFDDSQEVWEAARRMMYKYFIVHPKVLPKVAWDLGVAVFIMYSVLIVPYRLSWDIEPEGAAEVFDIFVDVFFAIDIVIAFRTSYLDEDGFYVVSLVKVAKAYLKGWFIIDFCSTVPIDRIFGSSRSLKMLRALRLAKLLRLLRLLKLQKVIGNKIFIPVVFADFIKNLFYLSFFAHLMAALWFSASNMQSDSSADTWVTGFVRGMDEPGAGQFDLNDYPEDHARQYLASLYWVYATYLGVGYGDVSATSTSLPEIGIAVFGMSFGTICFAMFISAVCNLVHAQLQAHGVRDSVSRMRDVMMDRYIPEKKRKHVVRNFKHFNTVRSSFYIEKEITDELPTMFSAQILRDFYRDNLLQVPKMKEMEDEFPLFFVAIEGYLQPGSLVRDEWLIRSGESMQSMFFLVSGGLEIRDTDHNCIGHLENKGTFGQACIDLPKSDRFFYTVGVRATKHSSLFTLNREHLPKVYRLLPHATNKFVEILKTRRHRKYIRIYHDKRTVDEYGLGHEQKPYFRCPLDKKEKWPPDPKDLMAEMHVNWHHYYKLHKKHEAKQKRHKAEMKEHEARMEKLREANADKTDSVVQDVSNGFDGHKNPFDEFMVREQKDKDKAHSRAATVPLDAMASSSRPEV